MSELLGTIETKKSLTTFLIDKSITHFQKKNIKFAVAGNGSSHFSFQDSIANNHEEGDTLIINLLCMLQPLGKDVVVHSVDTDVFTLLLRHYERFLCKTLYIKLVGGFVSLTKIAESLGVTSSKALLALHALTGCDTTGKFVGIGKGTWVKRFVLAKHIEDFMSVLSTFEYGVTENMVTKFSSFICSVYRHPRITKKMPEEEYDLSSTRYHLFRRYAAEGEKLPPSAGAFLMHMKRAFIQHKIWSEAHLSLINELNYLDYGFELQDNNYTPIPNNDPIAPEAIIEMVSCKSCKLCNTGRCRCRQTNQTCTDFCGCSEYCENTDSPMPENVMNDEDVIDDDENTEQDV